MQRYASHWHRINAVNEFWWRHLPARVNRVSPSFAAALTDGLYLSAWPTIGALLPPLALVLGFWLGWERIGYNPVDGLHFLYSLTTVLILVLVSQHGAALGCWIWLGFVAGDLAVYGPSPTTLFGGGIDAVWPMFAAKVAPRALADAVLLTLVVFLPLATAALTRSAVQTLRNRMRRRNGQVSGSSEISAVALLLRAVCSFVAVYLWLKAATVMLQGVYTWSGAGALTHGLVQSWNVNGFIVGVVAAYVAGVRSALVLSVQPRVALRVSEWRSVEVASTPAIRRAFLPLRAGFLTFVCGSLIDSWSGALALFSGFLAVFAVRELLQLYPARWLAWIECIPPFARALVAFVIVYFGAQSIAGQTIAASTFYPAQVAAMLSLLVFALALPSRATAAPPAARRREDMIMASRSLVVFGVGLGATLLWPLAAHAGFCPNLPNCFGGDPTGVGACAAGIGMTAGLCAPQKQGGVWEDHSDDFGGDDIEDGSNDENVEDLLTDDGGGPAPAKPPLPPLGC